MLYLEKEVFELISSMVYYLQVVSRAMPHHLLVSLSKTMPYRLSVSSADISNYWMICMVIKYPKGILIILACRVRYSDLYSHNITYRMIEECIDKSHFNIITNELMINNNLNIL